MFKDETLEAFSNGNKTSMATLIFYIVLAVLANIVRWETEIKSYHFKKEALIIIEIVEPPAPRIPKNLLKSVSSVG